MPNTNSQIIIYQTKDGETRLVFPKLMAELFQKDVRPINEH